MTSHFHLNSHPLRRLCALLLLAAPLHAAAADTARAVYDFNPGWRLYVGDAPQAANAVFDDASWKPVTLPHAWNEDDAFKKDIVDLSTGIAWYRKQFTLPASARGKKVFLEFEGVRQGAEVFVNGKSMGLHENGVMASKVCWRSSKPSSTSP